MATLKLKEILKREDWEKFVLFQNPNSFLQSWDWGEMNESLGFKVLRFGIYDEAKLIGAFQMIHQPAKRGPHFIIPGGPLIDWDYKKCVSFFVSSIRKISKDYKVWFVRIRPELIANEVNYKKLSRLGFTKSPMHLHAESTYVVNLEKSVEEILMGMRKNTRYEVRKSIKEDFEIIKTKDPKYAKVLYNLQADTIKRNKFVAFSERYFENQIKILGKYKHANLYLVKKGKKYLVAAIIINYGDSVYYHHSGSSDEARKVHASYRLQWEIIKDAKKMGLKRYDMWGASPEGNTKHRFYGPSLFKKGFGGDRVDWIKTHDLPINKLYWITNVFEHCRKLFRGL